MYTHRSKEKFGNLHVDQHQQLLVCVWRHGGVLVVKNKKRFSPLGTKLYFHVNSSKKICCVDHQHSTNMAALSRGCKPRIRHGKTRMWKELVCLWESRFKTRLQNSSYFCVSKYSVHTNSLTKAENGERGWGETLGFFLPPHTPVWGSYSALLSCKPILREKPTVLQSRSKAPKLRFLRRPICECGSSFINLTTQRWHVEKFF